MKKTIIVIFCAMVFGGLMAFYLFKGNGKEERLVDGQIKVQAFQIGVYTNLDNANRSAIKNNGIVIKDNDVYRVYVTLLKNDESIAKMEEYFNSINLRYYLKEVYVKNEFYDEIVEDENLIINSDQNTYNTINKDIINKFEVSV